MDDNLNNKKFSYNSVIFDLDGVITKTAVIHAAAWKKMFDEFLQSQAEKANVPFKEFTYEEDYLTYVDGKPRYKGVQSFLESRNVQIPFGTPDDSPESETICGLGNRKNIKFREVLEKNGVEVYQHVVDLIKGLIASEIRIGVASSSKNCQYILQSAGIEDLFETRVDGVVSAELGLEGKPQGDIFVKAAENIGSKPDCSVVVEDAVSGVQAGVNGKFGLVIGVARENNDEDLRKNGADQVVNSFEGVTPVTIEEWFKERNKK